MRHLFAVILYFLLALPLFANNDNDSIQSNDKQLYGKLSFTLTSTYWYEDTFEPYVTLICANGDTITRRENNGFEYRFDKVPAGLTKIIGSAPGYVSAIDTITVKPGKWTNMNRWLLINERVVDLQMVTVNGSVPAIVYKGDTIKYNTSGMDFDDNDKARKLLERLPGVEITDSGIKVNGHDIMKTYVDGSTHMFGTDVMTAVDHVAANNVAHVYVYEEDEHPEEKQLNKKGKRQHVMNIETKNKIVNSVDGTALTGIGHNIGKSTLGGHDTRYIAGTEFNFFSDQWLFTISGLESNQNIGDYSPDRVLDVMSPSSNYSENSNVSARVERKWQDEKYYGRTIAMDYSFGRSVPQSENSSTKYYTPTSDFANRTYKSTSENHSQTLSHNLAFKYNERHDGYYSNLSYRLQDSHAQNHSLQEQSDDVDGVVSSSSIANDGKNTKLSHRVNAGAGIYKKAISANVNLSYSNDSSDKKNERRTTYSNAGDEEMTISMPSDNRGGTLSLTSRVSYTFNANDTAATNMFTSPMIGISYDFEADNQHINQSAFNVQTQEIDKTNTYSYRSQVNTHRAEINFTTFRDEKHGYIDLAAGVESSTVEDLEKIDNNGYTKHFTMPTASASYNFPKFKGVNASLNYYLSSNLPNVSQLRSQVDDSNPYFLSSGNPNLKASRNNSFNLMAFRMGESMAGLMLNGVISGNFTSNEIVSSTRYFTEDTRLDEYQYTAKAGSSMSTYDNVDGTKSFRASASAYQTVNSLRSNFSVHASYSLSNNPYFYNQVLDRSIRNSFSTGIGIEFSKFEHHRISLNWNGNWSSSKNKLYSNTTRIATNNVAVYYRATKILKRIFLNVAYNLSCQKYQTTGECQCENELNIYAGTKIGKHGELSITAFDILGQSSGRKFSFTDNYTSESYYDNYGRFFSINYKYSIIKAKSNRSASGFGHGMFMGGF